MLRLARSRLQLRVGAVRIASVLGPRPSGLAVADVRLECSVQTSRFSSSRTPDEGSWTTLAVRNSVAWQQAVRPSFLTFLHVQKHLLVPVRFCVPEGDETWPREAWGYPLGKHAQWLRKQWREGGSKMDPTQKKELDEMSFAWDWTRYKWDHWVLPALRRFEELNGHTDVHARFVIPKDDPEWPEALWGQRLGFKVVNIRHRGDFAKQVKADSVELERLNFCHDSTLADRDWCERVLPALRVFRGEFGHCNVSKAFTVPSSFPWPKPAWRMNLGLVVGSIRSCGGYAAQVSRDRSELEAIDFVWDFFESEWSDRILPALTAFHRVNGHCRVSQGFMVPSDENWPRRSWDLKLGISVSGIRSADSYADQVFRDKSKLEAIGFVWDVLDSEWSDRIFPALTAFYRANGHCRVSTGFVVPSDENWPRRLWDLKLGSIVSRIRCSNSYADQVSRDKSKFEAIGFVWDFYESEWSDRILPALTAFHRVNGHCRVPRGFVVPSDENWPRLSWDLNLGAVVASTRNSGVYAAQVSRDMQQLEAISFVWDYFESEWSDRILPALKMFFIVNGNSRIPALFVVPSEAPWPESVHGLKLGYTVNNIRNRGDYFDHAARSIDELEAIGFELRISSAKWEQRVEPMLTKFEQLRGHRDVPLDFVVQSIAPWEEKDWGIALGKLRQKDF